ncbi:hypothetical protein CBW65_20495 [Tumebacillus avium]|uniref:SseB protein N-terminal domain-containing protein n=1 Tax=Tumebacillus avium TaxID=1903704 RepID=A0A1Y0IS55_9BACL|nr:hypothetical protein [Tumebacillus avium]ARU63090.1 hypothetical protein CBW65_20495 [Tumebacillus avium]
MATLTQEQIDTMRKVWEEHLPALGTAGEPFYTLMKFEGEQNAGEIFAYPGIELPFGRQGMVIPLFPTVEIAQECESAIRISNPEWRVVGVSETFLGAVLNLVTFQEIKLVIGTSPTKSIVCDTEKVPELVEKIREHGFSEELLAVAAADSEQ